MTVSNRDYKSIKVHNFEVYVKKEQRRKTQKLLQDKAVAQMENSTFFYVITQQCLRQYFVIINSEKASECLIGHLTIHVSYEYYMIDIHVFLHDTILKIFLIKTSELCTVQLYGKTCFS